jgi:cell division protease FtsH
MVCLFGMSEALGPVKMGDFSNHPHMRIDGLPPDGISNETEREIDLEVRSLIKEAYDNAKSCLTEHRDELEKLTAALLEKETLSIDEIKELLGMTPPVLSAIPLTAETENAEQAGNTETPVADENADA